MINKKQMEDYNDKKSRIMDILRENDTRYLDGICILKLCQLELDIIMIKTNKIFMETKK